MATQELNSPTRLKFAYSLGKLFLTNDTGYCFSIIVFNYYVLLA
ncbi:hypothetical protein [Levilactobacillus yonginensis]|nr:hypothetical protein [Levilactobacillus yonginensis]